MSVKSLRIFKGATKLYPTIIFVSATKISENVTNIWNCYFSNQIYSLTYQTKFTSHKQYLCGLLFYRNVKRTHAGQTILYFFVLSPKRNDWQTFKCNRSNKPFLQCVCYWYDLLRWMFFILCDNWKKLLFKKFSVTLRTFPTTMLLVSLKEVFQKRSIIYVISIKIVQC